MDSWHQSPHDVIREIIQDSLIANGVGTYGTMSLEEAISRAISTWTVQESSVSLGEIVVRVPVPDVGGTLPRASLRP